MFEKAIEESISGLQLNDRQEIARFYLEYLQESCQSVSFLRSTQASLKSRGLVANVRRDEHLPQTFSVSATGGEIQRDQGLYGADSSDVVLGKRAQSNGDTEEEGLKRQKM